MKILLSGFEAFPPFKENPTERLVALFSLPDSMEARGVELEKLILPVDFKQVKKIYPKVLKKYKPDIILNLGLDGSTPSLKLEHFAQNSGFDHLGRKEHFKIRKKGPSGLHTRLDTAKIAWELCHRGIPALRSDYAGIYLCNYTYYHSLRYCEKKGGNALFLHLPFSTELAAREALREGRARPSLPEKLLLKGMKLIVKTQVASF